MSFRFPHPCSSRCYHPRHALNAYAMSQSDTDEDVFNIKIYDCNFPNDVTFVDNRYYRSNGNMIIYRYFERDFSGEVHEYFYYDYSPCEGCYVYNKTKDNGGDCSFRNDQGEFLVH